MSVSAPNFAQHLAQAVAAGVDPGCEQRSAARYLGIATTAYFPFPAAAAMRSVARQDTATRACLHTMAAPRAEHPAGVNGARRASSASTPRGGGGQGAARVRPVSAPPPRVLTAAQAQALDALNACGAALTVRFTRAELRSAYRRLARRFHPDRHAHRTADTAALAQTFAAITAHYRLLADA